MRCDPTTRHRGASCATPEDGVSPRAPLRAVVCALLAHRPRDCVCVPNFHWGSPSWPRLISCAFHPQDSRPLRPPSVPALRWLGLIKQTVATVISLWSSPLAHHWLQSIVGAASELAFMRTSESRSRCQRAIQRRCDRRAVQAAGGGQSGARSPNVVVRNKRAPCRLVPRGAYQAWGWSAVLSPFVPPGGPSRNIERDTTARC